MKLETITFRIESDFKYKLQLLADKDKRKLSDFIRLKLEEIFSEEAFAVREENIKRIAKSFTNN